MKKLFFLLWAFVLGSTFAYGNPDSILLQQNRMMLKLLSNSKVSTQIFLGYRDYLEGNNGYNEFVVKRGYITFAKKLNKNISAKLAPDITIDNEGDGMGDLEMRLKYCYIDFHTDGDYWIFTNPKLLIGEIPTPWISFEEKINSYRIVSSQYLDDMKLLTSADFGVSTQVLLGGEISEEYQKKVNGAYPGKYGSIAIGVYNGGGYHAIENNNNKTIQWRFSLRPIPTVLPGLQFSYAGTYGKGNTNLYPDWRTNTGVASYESEHIVLTSQIYKSTGNYSGSFSDSLGIAYGASGWNTFAEVKLFKNKVSLFGSYGIMNYDDMNQSDNELKRQIVGLAYHIYKRNKIVVDYQRRVKNGDAEGLFEVMLELAL